MPSSKGYKNNGYGNSQYLMGQIPSEGVFNPYDYIETGNYKQNRRGQAQYSEDLAKLQYLAELRQQEFQNEYASPAQEALRNRQAGLNPDLIGLQGTPSASGPETSSNPVEGIPNNLQQSQTAVSMVSSVLDVVGSLVSMSPQLFGQKNAIGIASDAVNLFNSMPTSMDIPSFIQSSPLTSRAKRRLNDFHNSWIRSNVATTRGFKETEDNMKSRFSMYRTALNPYYNRHMVAEDMDDELRLFQDILTPIIDADNEFLLSNLDAQVKRSKYESKVFNATTGQYEADIKKYTRDFTKTQYELYQSLRGPVNDALTKLEKLDGRYEWAPWARAALSMWLITSFGNL